jgi:predicted dehydrogenase
MSEPVRIAVVGVGDFGRQHVRVLRTLQEAELVGVCDTHAGRAATVAREYQTTVLPNLDAVAERAQAACVCVPTVDHARVGCTLLERGVDVLVEKPMAATLEQADALIAAADRNGCILQVGHVERFNPAVVAAQKVVIAPLFFEVHRLGVFTPRSLDIDVVYDLMIHDLDIVLALVNRPVEDIRAVGIPVVTDKVDIAHARLEFAGGVVANLTASRVSTEKVRKLRLFQHHEYLSVDYGRRELLRIRVAEGSHPPQFRFEKLPVSDEEPLRAQLRAFISAVQTRCQPVVDGHAGRRALALADQVMAAVQAHARRTVLASANLGSVE